MKRNITPLWAGEAPYAAESPSPRMPALTEYACPGSRGAVIICPGGGYEIKADHEGAPVAQMLNEAGISAYVLDYHVYPCAMQAPLSDALRAIRLVRHMGYELVGILGFSAGGHLACSASTLYDWLKPERGDEIDALCARPDALIACYPVVTMGRYTHIGSRDRLLGALAQDESTQRRFSAELNVTPNTPPAFLWHTASDDGVPVQNTLQLAAAYAQNGVPFALHVFPQGPHGLGLAPEYPDIARWAELCQDWLRRLGFAEVAR
ncbi:MAG: alpha/beta hydrolase [Clostridia bacterium]|nr:alpha/beta hydrolase [Clostridia bacterium]